MTVGRVLTQGLGSFGGRRYLPTQGFGSFGGGAADDYLTTRLTLIGTSRLRIDLEGTSAERLTLSGQSAKRITIEGASP